MEGSFDVSPLQPVEQDVIPPHLRADIDLIYGFSSLSPLFPAKQEPIHAAQLDSNSNAPQFRSVVTNGTALHLLSICMDGARVESLSLVYSCAMRNRQKC